MFEALLAIPRSAAPPPVTGGTGFEAVLMHFDGTNGATVFIDECGHVLTNLGSPTVSTVQSKFDGASGLFNDSVTGFTDTVTLNGDYTVEAWVYQTALSTNYVPLISGNAGSFNFPLILNYNAAGNIGTYLSEGLNAASVDGGLTLNRWIHVAATREGNRYRLFVDGVKKADYTGTVVDVLVDRIGGWSTSGYRLKGYLDEVRVLKGKALYTADFTPPTERFTDPVRVVALLHLDGSNGQTTGFTDETGRHTFTAITDAKLSSTKKMFGTTALRPYTSTVGGRITTPNHPDFMFTGDFTIEGWFNLDTLSSEAYFFGMGPTLYCGITGTNAFSYKGGTTQNGSIAAPQIVANQWYHFAMVRKGTDLMLFVGGNLLQTKAGTSGIAGNSGSYTFDIGGWSSAIGGYDPQGYMDEIRITRGKALYTANFTPPTAPFTLS